MQAAGDIDYAADADLGTHDPYGTSRAEITSENGDVNIVGRLVVNGHKSARVEVDACRIRLAPGTWVENLANGVVNRLQAHESMSVAEGGALLSKDGRNLLSYRAAEKPPVLDGTILAAPELTVALNLSGCPVCGNSEVDAGESCDDGNVTPGDGCSVDCQLE